MTQDQHKDIKICKNMTRAYGTSYFISTYFFPKLLRYRTWVLYAFLRYPDEIVDTEERDAGVARVRLLEWQNQWQKAYGGDTNVHPVLRANALMWNSCGIPFEYSQIFLNKMLQDTEKSRYATYAELEDYMYGSATVVGYMMSYIIGFQGGALPYAKSLGEAFQLTNFLRDIKEDFERGRIYLPQDDWNLFSVTENDFTQKAMTENMKNLIIFEINRNEELYANALKGIPMLNKSGQRAVRIAFYLYKEILEKIKKDPERIWHERVRVSKLRKLYLIIKHF